MNALILKYRTLAEIVAAIILLGVGVGWWRHHDLVQQKIGQDKIIAADIAATNKQRAIDETLITTAKIQYEKDLAAIRTLHADQPVPVIVCHHAPAPGPVSAPSAPTHTDRPPGPAESGDEVHTDIGPALDLYSKRLERLNADARRLNSECVTP
jgi:hypothetical protein